MLPTDSRFSVKHLMIFLYLVSLVLLGMLIKWERDKEKPEFSLSSTAVVLEEGQEEVSLAGANLHAEINALSMTSLVDEKAVLWRLLDETPVTEVAVQGDLLLIASSERGKVLSARLEKDGTPRFLGSVQLPEGISRISIVGDKALVCLQRHNGVAVLDIQDPGNLRLVEILNETGLVTDSVTSGSQVFYADIYEGLGLIDTHGSRVEFSSLAKIDSPWRISKVDSRLAVGTLKDKVYLYDVPKDSNLRDAGVLEFPVNIRGVAMTDDALSVALADGSLHIYEMGGWPELKEVARLDLPGSPLNLKRLPGSSKIVVSIVSGGLALVDLQTPSHPLLDSHLKRAKTFKGLAVQADTIYGGSRIGLEAFSVAAIEGGGLDSIAADAMVSKGFLRFKRWNDLVVAYADGDVSAFAPTGRKSDVKGRYLALNDNDSIALFELQGNGRFQKVGPPINMNGVRDVMVLGDYLYILYQTGLQIRYCSDSGATQIVAEMHLPGVVRVLEPLDSKTMLVATRDDGVLFVDISSPASPGLITTIAPQRHLQAVNIAYDLLVANGRVYISSGPGGVYVLDASRRETPRLIQKIETRGFAKRLEMVDGLLLVADGLYGLFVIDTTTYDVAVPIGNLPLPSRVNSMAVAADKLFVSSFPGGTMKLPLPRRITAVEHVTDEELTLSLEPAAGRQQVYLYDNRNSVSVEVTPEALINQNL